MSREAFEKWASGRPHECDVSRFPEHATTWPGDYRDIAVSLSWLAWQASCRESDSLLRRAVDALEKSYDAVEWPANGSSLQEQTAAAIRQHLEEGEKK